VLTVVAGGALAQFLTTHVPEWSAGTLLEDLGGAVEFPVYAIIIGLVLNAVLSAGYPRETGGRFPHGVLHQDRTRTARRSRSAA